MGRRRLFYDDANRADNAVVDATNWTENSPADWSIDTLRFKSINPITALIATPAAHPPIANCRVSYKRVLTGTSWDTGIVARSNSTGTSCYFVDPIGTGPASTMDAWRVDGGTLTNDVQVGTTTTGLTFADGDIYAIETINIGTTAVLILGYLNDVLVLTATDSTANRIMTPGQGGIINWNNTNYFGQFLVEALDDGMGSYRGVWPQKKFRARATKTWVVASTSTSPIQGAAVSPVIVAASASGDAQLRGAAITPVTAAARLTGDLPATAASVSGVIAAGRLGGALPATGAAIAEAIAAGTMTGAGALNAASVALSFAAAGVQASAQLSAASMAGVIAAGVLTDFQSGNLLGAAISSSLAAALAAGAAAAFGATTVTVTASASLQAVATLTGAAVSSAVVAGLLTGLAPGSLEAGSITFTTAAGVLISLTPAGPEQTGGGLARRHEPDLRQFKFYDLSAPASIEVSSEAEPPASDGIVSAFLRAESVKSSRQLDRQREALALLLLMV